MNKKPVTKKEVSMIRHYLALPDEHVLYDTKELLTRIILYGYADKPEVWLEEPKKYCEHSGVEL